jgi:phosphoribosyl-AMP cyclohydrolase / phosphoribosyl-ATP pyrophosphohydrolase
MLEPTQEENNRGVDVQALSWNAESLLPAIVQDAHTPHVLVLAYMNAESLRLTLETGEVWLWSRSRASLWHKGATSGNIQRVCEIRVDCDQDALLLLVQPAGPACHTGQTSCFYRPLQVPPHIGEMP